MAPSNPSVRFMTVLLVVITLWKAALDALPRYGFETLMRLDGPSRALGYRIFLAKFSTKPRSLGTNLGLSQFLYHSFGEASKQWNCCDHICSVMLPHARGVLNSNYI
jgi:hypothetical protein